MEQDEKHVEELAKVLYNTQVTSAREDVDKIAFDAKELPDLFKRLKDESETGQVLIFASYLEDRMQVLIKSRLHHLDAKAEADIFGSNGPFSTFGSQISLACHLGWISQKQRKILDAFRKIRNEFAHKAFKAKFSDQSIADRFALIDYDVAALLTRIRAEGEAAHSILPDEEITQQLWFLCRLALLADSTFMDLLLLPSALAYRVHPTSIASSFDEAPERVRELKRELASTILILLKRPS